MPLKLRVSDPCLTRMDSRRLSIAQNLEPTSRLGDRPREALSFSKLDPG